MSQILSSPESTVAALRPLCVDLDGTLVKSDTLIESHLGIPPAEVLFVSSNPFDACGAKAFGLNVAWIERVTVEAMALACVKSDAVPPLTMFKAIRMQMDELGLEPDYRIKALSDLPGLLKTLG